MVAASRLGRRLPLRGRRPARLLSVFATAAIAIALAAPAQATELDDADAALAKGQYQAAITAARSVLKNDAHLEWHVVLMRGLSATGQRAQAAKEAALLIERYPSGLRALGLAHDAFLAVGDETQARVAAERQRAVMSAPGHKIEDAEELVAAGRAALRAGDEPKTVLSTYFERALQADPGCKAAFLAGGTLALDKHDDALAAEWFGRGLAKLGPDADLHAGLARAHYEGDREEMTAAIDAALHINPQHVPALLLRAEHQIDAEDHTGARATLDKVTAIDGKSPAAWAFRAVLAHLGNDGAEEQRARKEALSSWATNPHVDTLIGRKLSQNYRFSEAAAYQRRALAMAPGHLPAKAQLAQDLLRLGQTKAGWALAEEVHRTDGYDVAAYNLVTLRGHLDKFATLTRGGFVVRMEPREAALYGDEVVSLLGEASARLDAKYGFARKTPVGVEIFPDQADFAVRTFGMPGGGGYLGVCFGGLITMNSPAGTGAAPVSWRSVLWHEYAHVVTLGLTGNKIPRWLSEGISVHEELARDPTWGQRMTPRYREMIRGGELAAIDKLSGAFLAPKTPAHIMFAYYQSAMAVDFLVERHGAGALRAILGDLGRGVSLNAALAARTAPIAQLDAAWKAYAKKRADDSAPTADFREPDAAALAGASEAEVDKALRLFRQKHPDNLPALLLEAGRLVERGALAEARPLFEKAVALAPDQVGPDSPYLGLAEVWRRLGKPAEERKVLEALAARSSGLVAVPRRLIELDEGGSGAGKASLLRNADRLLAINPMLEAGWRARGRALEDAGDEARRTAAIVAYSKLLQLGPIDAADTRLRLARLERRRNPGAAKRHLLDALAEAPRLLPAHELLLELATRTAAAGAPP